MPYIDVKISKKITDEQKELLKSDLGKAITLIQKPETFLMIGICDGYDLYFAGKKLASGAYVSVSALGTIDATDSVYMTKRICKILEERFAIDPSNVYVTYTDVANWGWNSDNF